jgi:tight adherence protein B
MGEKNNEDEGNQERPIEYETYGMSTKEKTGYILLAGIFVFVLGFIFYRDLFWALLITPVAFYYPNIKKKEIIQKRKDELNFQFKDLLYSLSSSLSAGRSMESAFEDAFKDLQIIYPDEESLIIKECRYFVKNLEMNEGLEDILDDFEKRAHLEDVTSFVDVLKSCRKAGGNIVEVIRTTTGVMNDKIEIRNEIQTMIAAKKFEQKMMSLTPVAMILILSVAAGDYMKPLFNTLQGRLAMTVAMMVLVMTYFVSGKIMEIKV